MNQISEARLVELPRHVRGDGEVIVAEAAAQVPFRIERMFTIGAPAGAKRGRHAHRLCSQFMICVSGAVEVVCEDGRKKKTFALDRRNLALLVPSGVVLVGTTPAMVSYAHQLFPRDAGKASALTMGLSWGTSGLAPPHTRRSFLAKCVVFRGVAQSASAQRSGR